MSKLPTIEEFVTGPQFPNNSYVRYKSLEIYMRKGPIVVDDVRVTALTIANIVNRARGRSANIGHDPNHKRTGLFREFEDHIREIARREGYDGIYREIVHNEFLPEVLIRYGYKQVNIRGFADYIEKNFWYSVKEA